MTKEVAHWQTEYATFHVSNESTYSQLSMYQKFRTAGETFKYTMFDITD